LLICDFGGIVLPVGEGVGSIACSMGLLPFVHFLLEQVHVFLPEVANDLSANQYAPRSKLGG
jgi:hypothetical protein